MTDATRSASEPKDRVHPCLRILDVSGHDRGSQRAHVPCLAGPAQGLPRAGGGVCRGGPALGRHRGAVAAQGDAAPLPGGDQALPPLLHRPAGRALRLGARSGGVFAGPARRGELAGGGSRQTGASPNWKSSTACSTTPTWPSARSSTSAIRPTRRGGAAITCPGALRTPSGRRYSSKG